VALAGGLFMANSKFMSILCPGHDLLNTQTAGPPSITMILNWTGKP
jgi:hypothetical protein